MTFANFVRHGAILGCLLVACGQPDPAAGQTNYGMQGYTTRTDKDDRCLPNPADPVNVAFLGTHASWQNTMRAIGFRFDDGDKPTRGLEWRTTRGVAGGTQCVKNGGPRTLQDAQSARGSGVRGGHNAKRHIRLFEQTLPFSLNKDASVRWYLTVGDAHRDRKSVTCPGPGAVGVTGNDRVPRLINGRSGYDDAQHLFIRAFPPHGTPGQTKVQDTGNRGQKFMQCAGSKRTRYKVPWNGQLYYFNLSAQIGCQKQRSFSSPFLNVDAWRPLGNCPTDVGREGSLRL